METNLRKMEALFMALADGTRLRLINLMREGEICVCYFTEALQEPQPKISRHLAYLRQAGLVETTREGKWIYYRIAQLTNEHAAGVLRETTAWLANNRQMQADRERLIQISCCESKTMPIAIQRAPRALRLPKADTSKKEIVVDRANREELADFML